MPTCGSVGIDQPRGNGGIQLGLKASENSQAYEYQVCFHAKEYK
jgi:hypothetical protein